MTRRSVLLCALAAIAEPTAANDEVFHREASSDGSTPEWGACSYGLARAPGEG